MPVYLWLKFTNSVFNIAYIATALKFLDFPNSVFSIAVVLNCNDDEDEGLAVYSWLNVGFCHKSVGWCATPVPPALYCYGTQVFRLSVFGVIILLQNTSIQTFSIQVYYTATAYKYSAFQY